MFMSVEAIAVAGLADAPHHVRSTLSSSLRDLRVLGKLALPCPLLSSSKHQQNPQQLSTHAHTRTTYFTYQINVDISNTTVPSQWRQSHY